MTIVGHSFRIVSSVFENKILISIKHSQDFNLNMFFVHNVELCGISHENVTLFAKQFYELCMQKQR